MTSVNSVGRRRETFHHHSTSMMHQSRQSRRCGGARGGETSPLPYANYRPWESKASSPMHRDGAAHAPPFLCLSRGISHGGASEHREWPVRMDIPCVARGGSNAWTATHAERRTRHDGPQTVDIGSDGGDGRRSTPYLSVCVVDVMAVGGPRGSRWLGGGSSSLWQPTRQDRPKRGSP